MLLLVYISTVLFVCDLVLFDLFASRAHFMTSTHSLARFGGTGFSRAVLCSAQGTTASAVPRCERGDLFSTKAENWCLICFPAGVPATERNGLPSDEVLRLSFAVFQSPVLASQGFSPID